LALFLLAAAASAQIYPGGYPGGGYPGGGYPGGGYPGGGYPGGGYPGGGYPGGTSAPLPGSTRGNQGTPNKNAPLPNFRGKLKQMDAKSISIKLDDDREMDFKRTDKTKFFKNGDEVKSPSDFKPGDQVSVEGPEDMAGNLTAVNVYWEKAAAAGSQTADKDGVPDTWGGDSAKPSTAVKPPPTAPDADDPGRPVLKRGGPADPSREQAPAVPAQPASDPDRPVLRRTPATAADAATPPPAAPAQPASDPDRPVLRRTPATVADATVPPPPAAAPRQPSLDRDDPDLAFGAIQQDPLIRKAANAAMDFTETLPNYVCQELVTRYVSESTPARWEAQDVVTMEVVYENGKEDYRNITVGGKPFKGSMDDTGGAWSTGEFGTVLINLFNPGTAAQFHFKQDSRAGGVMAKEYSFEVAHENSHWQVKFGSQIYVPGYTGNVWIDPSTGRVLRIEMDARRFPGDFLTDHVESATDYEYVRLGGTDQYLLPVHSETLSCERGSSACARNTIDFRNYKKFEGQSTVTFGDAK
jgi:hypothetical protein